MARRFAKVSEEEIEEAFFYPSDLVNTKTTIPFASLFGIYPPLFTFPSGDSCIIKSNLFTDILVFSNQLAVSFVFDLRDFTNSSLFSFINRS